MFHRSPFWGGWWNFNTKTSMSTGKVVLGTLAGLAVGAAAGILFAPEKGSTTRRQIMDKGDDYVDKLKSKFDELSDSLAAKFKSTKNDAEELVDKGKEKFYDVKNDAENLVEKAKEKYNYTQKDVKNATSNFKHNGF